jgi:hypothetical protein
LTANATGPFRITRVQVSQNVLLNWASLSSERRVRPIVYYTQFDATGFRTANESRANDVPTDRSSATKTILDLARLIGWEVYEVPQVVKYELPVFKAMFFDAAKRIPDCAFYAYSNGDILFTDSLVETLVAVSEVVFLSIVASQIRCHFSKNHIVNR